MYGIANCDTVKRARDWLARHDVAYEFHDYKKAGVEAQTLQTWVDEHGWEVVLNRSGTTFRKLPEEERSGLNAVKAIDLMLAQPSMIKRPVLDLGGRRVIGFNPDLYQAALIR